MFERFTDRSRRVLVYAQEEARDFNHAYIGTEHMLLGLLREGDGVAAKTLNDEGVSYEVVHAKVNEMTDLKAASSPGAPPFTPRAKKVLELSLREALQFGHTYIGTEHILLGLIREGDGLGARILVELGVTLAHVRESVLEMMSGQSGDETSQSATPAQLDGAILRSVVRTVGQQLRPDLDAPTLNERASKIADELFVRLRRYWDELGDPD